MIVNVTERQKQRAGQMKQKPRNPFYVVLENVRSMYNVGSAFRTSDACLVSQLFLTGYTASPPRKEISKTALGAEEWVPWKQDKDTVKLIKEIKQTKNIQLVAVEQTVQSVRYTDFSFAFPVCLVFGNEILGIAKETLKFCDAAIYIPMLGAKESLNVATAYGIVLYEVLRRYQRRNIQSPITNIK